MEKRVINEIKVINFNYFKAIKQSKVSYRCFGKKQEYYFRIHSAINYQDFRLEMIFLHSFIVKAIIYHVKINVNVLMQLQ